ncbi:hypothetical protein [Brevibacterium sp. UCMA 11752]|uniref:hypothetical protein n=1 Tax=Brevibacterium sp. UCMA 11752 TaxID=2745946 RepID=UPI001F29887E|nr:hypothetical protein [Brevibacterium sp. UCMA 11752]MCF2585832.1 hypothetical protein [Brevibacterium sp. UCMA 11752]
MNSKDRLAYRGLVAAGIVLPVLAFLCAAIGIWLLVALFGSTWMIAAVCLMHMQTRVLNSGARALRDSVARRGGDTDAGSDLAMHLDTMAADLALMRAHAQAEPTQDEVRDDLVRLAHSLRREMRLLQYAVTVHDEPSASAATAEPRM